MKKFSKKEVVSILLTLSLTVCLNTLVYGGAKILAGDWKHYNLETGLDKSIPFLPWTLSIYIGCYLIWAVNYILAARREPAFVIRFFTADTAARLICFAWYLLLPTTNTRPVVPETGFWNQGMQLLYAIDSAENLFPSIHCMNSWFCQIAVRGKKEIPAWYRSFTLVAAAAVFCSVLTTKQHVAADVAGGVLLAEICWKAAENNGLQKVYIRLRQWWDSIWNKLFRQIIGDRNGKRRLPDRREYAE